jgi:hypothetical protein
MSTTRTSAQTRRNRLIAMVGVAILGVSITLGPYGLLFARTTECVWEICALRCRIMAPIGILV